MGRHKPTKVIENQGELETIRYPDERTFTVKRLHDSGLIYPEIAERLNLSVDIVYAEMKLFKETARREMSIDDLRGEVRAFIPEAYKDIRKGMNRGTGHIGLRLLEGLGVLTNKLELGRIAESQPTETQVKELIGQLLAQPVLRQIVIAEVNAYTLQAVEHIGEVVDMNQTQAPESTLNERLEDKASNAMGVQAERQAHFGDPSSQNTGKLEPLEPDQWQGGAFGRKDGPSSEERALVDPTQGMGADAVALRAHGKGKSMLTESDPDTPRTGTPGTSIGEGVVPDSNE